jgi:hypothetical protein
VAAGGLAVLVAAQLTLVRDDVEKDLAARSNAALHRAGIVDIGVSVIGRDVHLTGAARTDTEAATAVRVVRAERGVRVVIADLHLRGSQGAPAPTATALPTPVATAPAVTATPHPTASAPATAPPGDRHRAVDRHHRRPPPRVDRHACVDPLAPPSTASPSASPTTTPSPAPSSSAGEARRAGRSPVQRQ